MTPAEIEALSSRIDRLADELDKGRNQSTAYIRRAATALRELAKERDEWETAATHWQGEARRLDCSELAKENAELREMTRGLLCDMQISSGVYHGSGGVGRSFPAPDPTEERRSAQLRAYKKTLAKACIEISNLTTERDELKRENDVLREGAKMKNASMRGMFKLKEMYREERESRMECGHHVAHRFIYSGLTDDGREETDEWCVVCRDEIRPRDAKINRLRAERDSLKAEVERLENVEIELTNSRDSYWGQRDALAKENDELKTERDETDATRDQMTTLYEDFHAAESERDALAKRVAELEQAMEPIALIELSRTIETCCDPEHTWLWKIQSNVREERGISVACVQRIQRLFKPPTLSKTETDQNEARP